MAKTLQEFREWAVAQGGNIGNPVINNYRGQCVSLVQQYLYQVFDVPYAARGNAKDFVPPNFNRVSGAVRAGDPNGLTEVFVYDIAAKATYAAGFYAQAPTDSSTILLPVVASDLPAIREMGPSPALNLVEPGSAENLAAALAAALASTAFRTSAGKTSAQVAGIRSWDVVAREELVCLLS